MDQLHLSLNLRRAGHLEPIIKPQQKVAHLSSFQKHEETLQYTQEQKGSGGTSRREYRNLLM